MNPARRTRLGEPGSANPARVLTVDHVTILVNVLMGFDARFTGAGVEAFIATVDPGALAKR